MIAALRDYWQNPVHNLGNYLGISVPSNVDIDYGIGTGLGYGSLFWNKLVPSRVWYKDSPYML